MAWGRRGAGAGCAEEEGAGRGLLGCDMYYLLLKGWRVPSDEKILAVILGGAVGIGGRLERLPLVLAKFPVTWNIQRRESIFFLESGLVMGRQRLTRRQEALGGGAVAMPHVIVSPV